MNIMRKLLVGHSRGAAMGEDPPLTSQHTALGLMHLHKLFGELAHPPQPLNQNEQEQRLYNMLPLFCKVFGNCPSTDLIEKFTDILLFCQMVARLMVNEIRRRASNQSTEAASCAIAKFLEISSTEERSSGWMLLTAVNLLAAGNAPLIDIMTASSLPSTLVKCLYLFFDLPALENPDDMDPECEFSPRERRILLQKVFVQVLVRLCSHSGPAEELSRKDDLSLLFSAITNWCPPHNMVWRKSAAEVLMTLSRHGLTHSVVSYIHNKGCISLCLENMQRVQELSPLEIVEMFVTVFCFLKDSSEVSQLILDDFRTSQGYIFLSEFLLRLEQNTTEEACDALRNLVLLIASLTACGFIELKPSQASSGSLFQLPGFQIPHLSGASVRNLQAFQVLQSVFMKAQTSYLCCLLLDAVSTVYHSDKANYFILESQHTLSQFAEKIHLKSPEIQEKFFKLLEYVIFDLNFVPCKELISLSILLKTQNSTKCSILCLKSLLNILHSNVVFKDVFREVGLLEVLVTCLHRYAALLKEAFPEGTEGKPAKCIIPEDQRTLGSLIMNALTALLSSNSSNAGVFRESGGARCAHNMVPYHICRQSSLGIVQQLVLSNGGDDDMGTLLGLMHTAPVLALDLKSHILKSLLFVLRESHRTRTVFRKVGGFVYVMSVLVSMEGCLAEPPKPPWNTVEKKDLLVLLRTVFNTLAMAMRYEPANARFFASEICHTSLTDTIRLLGCFSNHTDLEDSCKTMSAPSDDHVFHLVFSMAKDTKIDVHDVPTPLISSCLIFRLMYDTATDAFDKANTPPIPQSFALRRVSSEPESSLSASETLHASSSPSRRSGMVFMNFSPPTPEPLIVHPGVVVSMLHLLPSIHHSTKTQLALTLQMYLAEVLRSLVRSERNQQVMCESGLPGELLSHCRVALENEPHPLHPPLQYILERLAAQSLEPKDLKAFLRLGSPLCCTPFGEGLQQDSSKMPNKLEIRPANQRDGGPVPLTRVKTLVSMTTPRDCRLHGTSIMPPFVEFDMSSEGFSCLYLPSIAPQSVASPAVVGVGMVSMSTDSSVIGGIGTGDRVFPPQTGLSFSTWFCTEKFSDPHTDPHSIRLLTLVRNIQNRDELLICLSIQISSRDKALLLSTTETHFQQSVGGDWEPEVREECCVRVWCPELLQEGQWHHLVVVLNRAVLKNSSVSVYMDGQHHSTQKLHYVSQNPGGGAANLTVATSVFGFIGTPPQFRHKSRLFWKQGPCHLVEEVLPPAAVAILYQLGPCYTGSLQSPTFSVSEERIVFGINAAAVSVMTLAKIRRVYSKADCKAIAKMLGMSSHENATPIHILHNSGGHLSGPARSLGGILVGYLGARTFVPHPVSLTIDNVGGTATLLGLVAMAKDVEGLYAAVKALVCVVKSNRAAQQEMDRMRRYQTLALLFKKKRQLLNSHILHLTFSLVGTVDSGRENTSIPNTSAFEDLLCDLEVWQESPGDLQKSLYEHFYELVAESSERKQNLKILRDLNLSSRLLLVLKQLPLSSLTCNALCRLLRVLLLNTPRSGDVRCFGQFIAATLPSVSTNEKPLLLGERTEKAFSSSVPHLDRKESTGIRNVQSIQLRNHCLTLFGCLLIRNGSVNHQFGEFVIRCLGYDWLLLFLQKDVHPSTVILALKILTCLLSHPQLLQLFKDSTVNGGWLDETDAVLKNRMDVVLGFNMSPANSKPVGNQEISSEACHVPGFQHLQWLMTHHIEIPESYFCLLSILLGFYPGDLPDNPKLTMDALWSYLFGAPTGQTAVNQSVRGELCYEAAVVLLAMIRSMLNQYWDDDEIIEEYPVTLLQFLISLYHNRSDFMMICMTQDVIAALVATLFPINFTENENQINSPVEEYQSYADEEDSFIFLKSGNANNFYRDGLTNHRARKFVMDFLRVVVVDSLSLPSNPKQAPVIDLMLEAIPVDSTHNQQMEFQMDILSLIMDHLINADVLLGEQAAMPIITSGSYTNIPHNVFYFTSSLVDRLWQGVFAKNSHKVLDFIIKIIVQGKRKGSSVSLVSLFHCLNRTILYQLSRPMENVVDQMVVLECLQKLAANRSMMFASANNDPEFFGCLGYCLLQLTEDPNDFVGTNRHTTWHVPIRSRSETGHKTSVQEAATLISNAALRVWDELYASRRQVLEEICKSPLSNFTSFQNTKAPPLESLRPVLHEPLHRHWQNFVDSERKQGYTAKETWQFQTHIQTRLQKVTGGLSRLASRKIKREPAVRIQASNITAKEMEYYTANHVSIVKDFADFQIKQYLQSHQCLQKYVFEEWLQTEAELTRERALWGPPIGSHLDKWILDMTEGPCRMRKKMVKNELFYIHYPYRPEVEGGDNRALKYKVATSFDSKEYYKRWRPENMVEHDMITVDTSIDADEISQDGESTEEREIGFQGLRTACLLSKSPVNRSSDWDDDQDVTDPVSDSIGESDIKAYDSTPENQNVLRLLEEGEKISHMFRCARIQGLDTCEGLLLFGKEHFYVVDGFTLLKTREIRDIDSLPVNMHDPIIPNSAPRNKHQKRMCSKFSYDEIRDVHKRRYLLQPIALEVFSADGRTYLLAFPRKIRNKVYTRFLATATAITDSAQESLSGQKRGANVESSANLLSNLIGDTSVTQRWVRGEISNFQYLMFLNTLAGRSYNDLMQYPVFPWILADYDSEEMDLNDPTTFRDFSRPMGAQTPDRLNQFQKRFKEWDDPHGETPPYHYGTFYSSAMIVASYLVRMEPFTQHFLHLQGGHFDLADRMFHSIKDAWFSAAKHNMADVKELIPEFFYLPEFLANSNHYDLGCKQNGILLNDVLLPPWAKNDPREFIRVHRQALECDYVSSHLHEWIDLIFGYKQQGPPAIEAVNVFHHLFYEGNVDIYSIDDPLKKNATIGFINNFGQIPKQLFKKPHPSKKITNRTSVVDPGPIMPGLSYSLDKLFFHNLDNLRPSLHPVKDLKGPVGHIVHHDKNLYAVEQHKVLVPPQYTRYVAWGFADHSIRTGPYETEKASFVWEDTPAGEILCCACPNDKIIITAGTNSMVTVWQYDKKKLGIKQNLYGHTEPVTCLAASRAYNLIVSGSRDRTCIVWDLSRLSFVRQLLGHPAPVAAVAINVVTGDIATCAGTHLFLWTINGDEIASVNTATGRADRTQQILCVAFSHLNEWDNQNVVMTGSSDGVVRMWSTDYVQIPEEHFMETKEGDAKGNTISDVEQKLAPQVSVSEEKPKESKAEEIVRKMSLAGSSDLEGIFGELMQRNTLCAEHKTRFSKSASGSSLSEEEKEDEENGNIEETGNKTPVETPTKQNTLSLDEASKESSPTIQIQHSKTVVGFHSEENSSHASDVDDKVKSMDAHPNTHTNFQRCSTVGAGPAAEAPPEDIEVNGCGKMRLSKSETSLTDSFVNISENDVLEAEKTLENSLINRSKKKKKLLKDGFKWHCQLVFRSKLTMHTAFDRKDNTEPAAITALAVSRDHKTVYVGDSRGRVFSWSVTDNPGRAIADHWVRDEGGDSCVACGVRFSFAERRHHCRNCGQLFCSKCSRFESEISRLRILKPVRVCQGCYQALKSQHDDS